MRTRRQRLFFFCSVAMLAMTLVLTLDVQGQGVVPLGDYTDVIVTVDGETHTETFFIAGAWQTDIYLSEDGSGYDGSLYNLYFYLRSAGDETQSYDIFVNGRFGRSVTLDPEQQSPRLNFKVPQKQYTTFLIVGEDGSYTHHRLYANGNVEVIVYSHESYIDSSLHPYTPVNTKVYVSTLPKTVTVWSQGSLVGDDVVEPNQYHSMGSFNKFSLIETDDSGLSLTVDTQLTFFDDQTTNARNIAVASDSAGDTHVVWIDDRNGINEVYYQKLDSGTNGTKVFSDTKVSEPGFLAVKPDIALDSKDHIYITFQTQTPADGGAWEIYYMKLQVDTTRVQVIKEPTRVSGAGVDSVDPSIEIDSKDNVYILWRDIVASDEDSMQMEKMNHNATLSYADDAEIAGRVNTLPVQHIGMDFHISDNDDLYFVWNRKEQGSFDNYGLTFMKMNESLNVTRPPITITPAIAQDSRPRFAIDSHDNLHIIYADRRYGGSDIIYTKVTGIGHTLIDDTPITPINDYVIGMDDVVSSTTPRISLDGDDITYIMWADDRFARWLSFFVRLNSSRDDNNGDVGLLGDMQIGEPVVLSTTVRNSTNGVLAVDAENNTHFLWEDTRTGQSLIYYRQTNKPDLQPNDIFLPSTSPISGENVTIGASFSNKRGILRGEVTVRFLAQQEGKHEASFLGEVMAPVVNGDVEAEFIWNTTGFMGNVTVSAQVNPESDPTEVSAWNNMISGVVFIRLYRVSVVPNITANGLYTTDENVLRGAIINNTGNMVDTMDIEVLVPENWTVKNSTDTLNLSVHQQTQKNFSFTPHFRAIMGEYDIVVKVTFHSNPENPQLVPIPFTILKSPKFSVTPTETIFLVRPDEVSPIGLRVCNDGNAPDQVDLTFIDDENNRWYSTVFEENDEKTLRMETIDAFSCTVTNLTVEPPRGSQYNELYNPEVSWDIVGINSVPTGVLQNIVVQVDKSVKVNLLEDGFETTTQGDTPSTLVTLLSEVNRQGVADLFRIVPSNNRGLVVNVLHEVVPGSGVFVKREVIDVMPEIQETLRVDVFPPPGQEMPIGIHTITLNVYDTDTEELVESRNMALVIVPNYAVSAQADRTLIIVDLAASDDPDFFFLEPPIELFIRNRGTAPDTIRLQVSDDPNGIATIQGSEHTLTVGQERSSFVNITILKDSIAGGDYHLNFTATSKSDPLKQEAVHVQLIIKAPDNQDDAFPPMYIVYIGIIASAGAAIAFLVYRYYNQ